MTTNRVRTAAAAVALIAAFAGSQALAQDRGFDGRGFDNRGVDARVLDNRGIDNRNDGRFDRDFRGDRGDRRGEVRQLQVRIDELQRVVERQAREGRLNRWTARRALDALNDAERQLRIVGRDGVDRRELRQVDFRVDRVEEELRRARVSFNGPVGRRF